MIERTFRRGGGAAVVLFLFISLAGYTFEPGDQVEILYYGSWFEGEILEQTGDRSYVHYLGWDDSYNEWVSNENLRYPGGRSVSADNDQVQEYPDGMELQVWWSGAWWDAQILRFESGQYLISYQGYDSDYDEWVPKDRIRLTPEEVPELPVYRPKSHYPIAIGDSVEIKQGFRWYEVEVVDIREGEFLIHYTQYSDDSNEWIPAWRVRSLEEGRDWDGLMYRFWYDLSPEGVVGYLKSGGSVLGISSDSLEKNFDYQLVFAKREVPYASVSASGIVRVGGELLGRITLDASGIKVFHYEQRIGTVDLQGKILKNDLLLGSISDEGRLTDAQGNEIGSIDQAGGSILFDCGSEWGWVTVDDSKIPPWVNRVTAAFLFFFTELPHAMQTFECDQ